jgi:hypothetical protein|nr:MAG TPA: hypothetical protein [Caudoviricetes sp.]
MNLYTTRSEAIEREIRDVLRQSEDVTGPIGEAFDIDAIANETITMFITEGGVVTYCLSADIYPDLFWEIVEKHAR